MVTQAGRNIVKHGTQALTVTPWTRQLGGLPPRVFLSIGETLDSQLMMLSASEARRVAMALLEAAEAVDDTHA